MVKFLVFILCSGEVVVIVCMCVIGFVRLSVRLMEWIVFVNIMLLLLCV